MARVAVIGGGFGGLASALRLAKLGHAVTLVEERELGGALVPFRQDDFTWDTATYTLLPAVVRDLFRKTGRPLDRELDLVQLDCVREHWFTDGTSLVLAAGRTSQHDAFEALGAGLGARWVEHVAAYADDWEVVRRGYAEVAWDPGDVPRDLAERLDSRETLHRRLRRLGDQRLRQVAAHPFAADGHDPRDVPAWAGLTAYLEQRFGAWAFTGGTGALLDALVRRLGTREVAVVRGRVRDVVVREGRAVAVATTVGEIDADVVVVRRRPTRAARLAPFVRAHHPGDPRRRRPTSGSRARCATCRTSSSSTASRPWCSAPAAWRPRATMHGRVQSRGRREDDPLAALARHGLDIRAQVVTRVDHSPRDLVERWGGTPARRAVAGARDGPAAARAAHPDRGRVRRGRARGARARDCPTSGSRPRWSPRWSARLAEVSAQLEGDGHRRGDRLLAGLEGRRRPSANAFAARRGARPWRHPRRRPAASPSSAPASAGQVGAPRDGVGVRRLPGGRLGRRPVGHLQRHALDPQPVADRLGEGRQQRTGRADVGAAKRQRVAWPRSPTGTPARRGSARSGPRSTRSARGSCARGRWRRPDGRRCRRRPGRRRPRRRGGRRRRGRRRSRGRPRPRHGR